MINVTVLKTVTFVKKMENANNVSKIIIFKIINVCLSLKILLSNKSI